MWNNTSIFGMENYIKRRAQPISRYIPESSDEEIAALDSYVVHGHFSNSGDPFLAQFKKLAQQYQEKATFVFSWCRDADGEYAIWKEKMMI